MESSGRGIASQAGDFRQDNGGEVTEQAHAADTLRFTALRERVKRNVSKTKTGKAFSMLCLF
jgi:hypothetical protein